MNREIVRLLAKSGLIPPELLPQFLKWKLIDDIGQIAQPKTAEELIAVVTSILEDDDMTLVRSTDIDIVRRYFQTQAIGKLVLMTADSPGNTTVVKVAFGRTLTDEIILPWRDDSIANIMTNGLTHLQIEQEAKGGLRSIAAIYFSDVKEAYFDSNKAFMICVPSTVESGGQHDDIA